MQISVIPYPQHPRTQQLHYQTVIILDIFRATSTIITAFAHGVKAIIPVATIQEAQSFRHKGYLLAGERQGKKIPEFDLNNSPDEFRKKNIKGKTIVLTTTNGTQAIHQARKAKRVLIGAFLNAKACAQKAYSYQQDIVILCSGTNGFFSLEDSVAAGCLIHELKTFDASIPCDELGLMLWKSYQGFFQHHLKQLMESYGAKRLLHYGLEQDVLLCLQKDRYALVPYLYEDQLII